MSESLKEMASKFRDGANGLEQEAARLRHEAKMLREAAYTLNPVGRKPGSKQRRRKPFEETDAGINERARLEAQATAERDKVEDVPEAPSITDRITEALRVSGQATAEQIIGHVDLSREVVSVPLDNLVKSGRVRREFDAEVAYYTLAE